MGSAEIALAVSSLGTLLVAILAFLGKGVLSDSREHDKKLADTDKRLAVLEASQLHLKVEDHSVRLVAIENGLHEIKSDLRVVKLWVESQSDPSRQRRSTDHKGD